jgi:hypothetical protein
MEGLFDGNGDDDDDVYEIEVISDDGDYAPLEPESTETSNSSS